MNAPEDRLGKSVIAVMSAARPLFLHEQTFASTHRTAVSCQERPHAPQQNNARDQLFSSRLSSLKIRQSVPCAMRLAGLALIMPASRSRKA
jgi:hypothetical protein